MKFLTPFFSVLALIVPMLADPAQASSVKIPKSYTDVTARVGFAELIGSACTNLRVNNKASTAAQRAAVDALFKRPGFVASAKSITNAKYGTNRWVRDVSRWLKRETGKTASFQKSIAGYFAAAKVPADNPDAAARKRLCGYGVKQKNAGSKLGKLLK